MDEYSADRQWLPPVPVVGAGTPAYLTDDPDEFIPLPPPAVPKRPRGRQLAVAATLAVVVAAAGVGAYAYSVLNGGGPQPESVLPSTAIGFAKIDLNPAANQKIALYQLSRHVPGLSKAVTSDSNLKDGALRQILAAGKFGLDYDKDVKPWLGDRAGVAVMVDGGQVYPVVALAVTDENKMKVGLARVEAETGKTFGYARLQGYEIISDSQEHAASAVAAAKKAALSSNAAYQADVASLPGDQIAVEWADMSRVASLQPAGGPSMFSAGMSGRMVLGVHATSSYLELAGSARGGAAQPPSPAATIVPSLPASTAAALEITGLGQRATTVWSSLPVPLRTQFQGMVGPLGLRLPADLTALLGTDAAVSVGPATGKPDGPPVALQVKTGQADRAISLVQTMISGFGAFGEEGRKPSGSSGVTVAHMSGGYLVTSDPSYANSLSGGGQSLADTSLFTSAVPHATGAVAVGFVNFAQLIGDPSLAQQRAVLVHLSALGFSVNPTSGGDTFDLRLLVK